MSEIVRFKGPSGDEMVILAAAEYQRLLDAVEDASDVAAYDRVKRAIANGEDELVPSEIADRLQKGENPIRVWREHRGMTSAQVAESAGIGQGFLSQIETGKREGTVATIQKIASALRVALDDLVVKTETPGEAQARVMGEILAFLRKVGSASDTEIVKAVQDSASPTVIMYARQRLLVENKIGHHVNSATEPLRYWAADDERDD